MPEDPVFYRSHVRIERIRGKLRLAYLPFEDEPVKFSIHSGIAAGYGEDKTQDEPHAATLDYVVAAAAG